MSTYVILPFFFFFNDTATTEIYTLSLHDALPICAGIPHRSDGRLKRSSALGALQPADVEAVPGRADDDFVHAGARGRSEEHTSELQSRLHLVCRLLLEKKKTNTTTWRARPRLRSH